MASHVSRDLKDTPAAASVHVQSQVDCVCEPASPPYGNIVSNIGDSKRSKRSLEYLALAAMDKYQAELTPLEHGKWRASQLAENQRLDIQKLLLVIGQDGQPSESQRDQLKTLREEYFETRDTIESLVSRADLAKKRAVAGLVEEVQISYCSGGKNAEILLFGDHETLDTFSSRPYANTGTTVIPHTKADDSVSPQAVAACQPQVVQAQELPSIDAHQNRRFLRKATLEATGEPNSALPDLHAKASSAPGMQEDPDGDNLDITDEYDGYISPVENTLDGSVSTYEAMCLESNSGGGTFVADQTAEPAVMPTDPCTAAIKNLVQCKEECLELRSDLDKHLDTYESQFDAFCKSNPAMDPRWLKDAFGQEYNKRTGRIDLSMTQAQDRLRSARVDANHAGVPNPNSPDQTSDFFSTVGDGLEAERVKFLIDSCDRENILEWQEAATKAKKMQPSEYRFAMSGAAVNPWDSSSSIGHPSKRRKIDAVTLLVWTLVDLIGTGWMWMDVDGLD